MAERIFVPGWIPDPPDGRDLHYHYFRKIPYQLVPESVDLRLKFSTIEDQGPYGTCVPHAVTAALEHKRPDGLKGFDNLSRLFVYYRARLRDGALGGDKGSTIRSALASVAEDGAPLEVYWPYRGANLNRAPSAKAMAAAQRGILKNRYRIYTTDIPGMQAALAEGYPIVFGLVLFASFFRVKKNGVIPIPDIMREAVKGGHAMLIVGYTNQFFIVRNSWGRSWGDRGYGYLPFEYLRKLPWYLDDFWAVGG